MSLPVYLLETARRPSYSLTREAFISLSTCPDQIRLLLEHEASLVQVQSNFARFSERIIELLEVGTKVGSNVATKHIGLANRLPNTVAVPLLDSSLDSFSDLDERIRLVATVIDFFLEYSNSGDATRFVDNLAQKKLFFEAFVSHKRGAASLKKLWDMCRRNLVPITTTVAVRLVKLVVLCPAGHGIDNVVQQWRRISAIHLSLRMILQNLEEEHRQMLQKNKIVPDTRLRILESDRDARHQQHPKSSQCPSFDVRPRISADICAMMSDASLPVPETKTKLYEVISHITDVVIPSLWTALLDTYPCRACYDLVSNMDPDEQLPIDEPGKLDTDGVNGEDCSDKPGSHVGLWRIFLSAQALKDVKNYTHSGMLTVKLPRTNANVVLDKGCLT